jgi:hypothetical protein
MVNERWTAYVGTAVLQTCRFILDQPKFPSHQHRNQPTSQQPTTTSVTIDTAESAGIREHGISCLVAAGNRRGTCNFDPQSIVPALEAIKLTTLHDRGELRMIEAGTLSVAMHNVGANKAEVQRQLVTLLIEQGHQATFEEKGSEITYPVLPESPPHEIDPPYSLVDHGELHLTAEAIASSNSPRGMGCVAHVAQLTPVAMLLWENRRLPQSHGTEPCTKRPIQWDVSGSYAT